MTKLKESSLYDYNKNQEKLVKMFIAVSWSVKMSKNLFLLYAICKFKLFNWLKLNDLNLHIAYNENNATFVNDWMIS